MKKLILTAVLSLCVYVFALAQTSSAPTATIKGTVTDSVKKQPLSYVTVAVVDASTNVPVK
jgi:hypothetical protein